MYVVAASISFIGMLTSFVTRDELGFGALGTFIMFLWLANKEPERPRRKE